MGRFIYKSVDTRSFAGLQEAKRLKASGWQIVSVGLWTIQFEKKITVKHGNVHHLERAR